MEVVTQLWMLQELQSGLGMEAFIIYRRDRENMPAHDFEAEEALTEGVKINWLRSIKNVENNAFTVEIMEIKDGKLSGTGNYETLEADALIMALGQDTDTGFYINFKVFNLKVTEPLKLITQ